MTEIIKKGRGGKRDGAGRPAGISTKSMSLKLDLDLYEILNKQVLNKNRFINDAVREKLARDGMI